MNHYLWVIAPINQFIVRSRVPQLHDEVSLYCKCTYYIRLSDRLHAVAFGAFMGNSSLGSDGGSDARGRAAPSWLQNERHGAPVRSH